MACCDFVTIWHAVLVSLAHKSFTILIIISQLVRNRPFIGRYNAAMVANISIIHQLYHQ